ncbi:transcription initiation factor TFIID 23-30kDa subunit-domain-containing protein [Cladochytrium replicatum]|nr:transcription initiation factor TFIID 23-30kDa subunit-domain-containing protein [Cladochytrium replicatum]
MESKNLNEEEMRQDGGENGEEEDYDEDAMEEDRDKEEQVEGDEEEEEEEEPQRGTGNGKDGELARKDRSLAELLLLMDDYSPIIPDAVTDYYLSRSGIECDDVRLKRLMALAAQKFIADVATDAMQHYKLRQQTSGTKGGRGQVKDKRTVLTMEDLSAALGDHGINVRRPDYFYESK